MAKSETKAYIEAWAKSTGKPAEEVASEIAALFGYQKSGIPTPIGGEEKLSPVMQAILEARKIEKEMGMAGKGEVSPVIKMMMETVTMMPLMKMMGSMGGQDSGQSINEIIAKNNETWERRLEQMKQEQKDTNLQRQLDDMKTLILSSSGSKKDELADKFDKLSEKLDEEKTKRFDDALATKSAEIAQLREDMAANLEDMRTQPLPKGADEGFFEMMQKMERFDNIVRSRGKALGMTDEQIEKQVAETTPMKQQILKDVFKTINRGIDAWSGKEAEKEEPEVPEVAEEPQETAAEKAARKRGEIPAETEQPAPTAPEEVLNIS